MMLVHNELILRMRTSGRMTDFSRHDILVPGFFSSVRLHQGKKELTFNIEDVMVWMLTLCIASGGICTYVWRAASCSPLPICVI